MHRAFEQDGHPTVRVDERDEVHAQEAGPGDVLLLKGHGWPGNEGGGAVHKSPDLSDNCGCCDDEADRLVLTIDRAEWD